MKKFIALALTLAVLIPAQAFAMDLAAAKQAGYVGEQADGLIGAVPPNSSPEVKALVTETNAGRMAVYTDTAAKQGIPVSQVQAIAAQKLIGMATSGQYVMTNGSWTKK